MDPIRLATRGSSLALAQAEAVARELREHGHDVEVLPVDRDGTPDPAAGPGGDKARFVRTVELALLEGRADIGVHSAKDLPADEVPDELILAAVPPRAPTADAWIGPAGDGSSLTDVPAGCVVGTASLRRRSQLLALRPDLDVRTLRGNIDTRLQRQSEGDYDAILLARAGLARLGREDAAAFSIPEAEMLPAAGQGALALQTRRDDDRAIEAARSIGDPTALVELLAERALVRSLEADCDSPVAARCRPTEGVLRLDAFVGRADGSDWLRDGGSGSTDDPEALGRRIGLRLHSAGATEMLHGSRARHE